MSGPLMISLAHWKVISLMRSMRSPAILLGIQVGVDSPMDKAIMESTAFTVDPVVYALTYSEVLEVLEK